MGFNNNEYRDIVATKSLEEVIRYLNNNAPSAGSSFMKDLNRKLKNRKLRKIGKAKLVKAYRLSNKNSIWRKVLKNKLDLLREGKVLKFSKKEFEKMMKGNYSLLKITKYLNEHPPGRSAWNSYVKCFLKNKASIEFYRLLSKKSTLKIANDIANKNSRHGKAIAEEYGYYGRYEGVQSILC